LDHTAAVGSGDFARQVATFHIDHIIPIVAGGETATSNLALADLGKERAKGIFYVRL
jgi:hypothetical protein